jgi:hypothetical protein
MALHRAPTAAFSVIVGMLERARVRRAPASVLRPDARLLLELPT